MNPLKAIGHLRYARIMRALFIACLLLVAAVPAHGFVPVFPTTDVQTNARWSAASHPSTDGKGLHDGISVAIEPGLAETLVLATLGAVAPEDVADVEDAIEAAFAGWESSVLAFDVTFDGPVIRSETAGQEIDV